PDGMDEVFLPGDAETFTRDGLVNAIRDDQFGEWLERLRDKGAAVWIIFDCCHAGDMVRAAEQPVERPRRVAPAALGITDKQIEHAVKRAAEAVKAQNKGELARNVAAMHNPLQTTPSKNPKGSMVAFYAAQPFEVTYEV